MSDDLNTSRSVDWEVLFSTVFWLLVGNAFWALMIRWGWVR
jgi:hypothetical protein